ncbi:GNAT family N-acetyltransferase [Paracoccus sp. T5]|uniref:GNAT family N-acetyltransferase n=1 Tax=Paracoccus sp. T5 TaxID=3402161 RepID=UPI003AD8674A
MIITAASPTDAKTLAELHRVCRQKAMPWLPELHSPEEDLRYFETRVLPVETVLIAWEGGHAAGFVSFHQGWLNHLYVAPDCWRLGFGTRLLEAVRSDLSYLQLWVFQKNARARHFYTTHGFCEREATDGRYNEERVPDLRMEWARHDRDH